MKKYKILAALLILVSTMVPVKAEEHLQIVQNCESQLTSFTLNDYEFIQCHIQLKEVKEELDEYRLSHAVTPEEDQFYEQLAALTGAFLALYNQSLILSPSSVVNIGDDLNVTPLSVPTGIVDNIDENQVRQEL